METKNKKTGGGVEDWGATIKAMNEQATERWTQWWKTFQPASTDGGAAQEANTEAGQIMQPILAFLKQYQQAVGGMFAGLAVQDLEKGAFKFEPGEIKKWIDQITGAPAHLDPALFDGYRGLWGQLANSKFIEALAAPPADFNAGYEHPLQAGLRHVFVGAHDAVGWGPYSALRNALRDLSLAETAWRRSQSELWQVVSQAWGKVGAKVEQEIQHLAKRGETIKDGLTLMRLITAAADDLMHQTLQSEAGLEKIAASTRSALQLKRAQSKIVELISQILDVPTRSEVDAAYRMIQELKRQVRDLQKARG